MLKKFTESMRERVQMFVAEMQAETGLSVVEMILILVVIIALVLIFKTQLTTLVNDIFEKITSESLLNQRDIFQHVPITSRKPVMPDSKGVPGFFAFWGSSRILMNPGAS